MMIAPQETWLNPLLTARSAMPGVMAAISGVENSLEHSRPWPPVVTGLLLLALIALVTFLYRNVPDDVSSLVRWVLGLLRISSLGLILLMMYRLTLQPHRVDLPDLEILVDDSLSMSLIDQVLGLKNQQALESLVQASGFEQVTRFNQASALLLGRDGRDLKDISERYHVHLHWLGHDSALEGDSSVDIEARLRGHQPRHPTSPLGDRLVEILQRQRGRSTAALLFFSDGITSEGRTLANAARAAHRQSVPLIVVAIGSDRPLRDIRLSDVLVDDLAYVNDVVRFDFVITSVGYSGKEAEVRLRDADRDLVVARRNVVLGADKQSVESSITVRMTEVGRHELVLEVVSQEGEVDNQNNRQTRLIDVRDDPLRVLLVQGEVNYEFRFLKQVLERGLVRGGGANTVDSPIELKTVLQSADPEYVATDATALRGFPARREDLFQYDVLILGDVDPSLLGRASQEQVVDFVKKRGGGLVLIAGPHFMPHAFVSSPLAEVIPIDISAVQLPDKYPLNKPYSSQLTRLGRVTPHLQIADREVDNVITWSGLPPAYWLLKTAPANESARVLVEDVQGDGQDHEVWPLIYLQYVGAGKVVFHATDETWRWRFRRGDELFDRYWTQTIRYLARRQRGEESGVRLTTDRERYRLGEAVRVQVKFVNPSDAPPADDGVQVVVTRQADRDRLVRLRRIGTRRDLFVGGIDDLGPGNYRISLMEPALEGDRPSREFQVLPPLGELSQARADHVQLQKAAELSGGAYYDVGTAPGMFKRLPIGRRMQVEALPPIPIWNSWRLALLLLLLLIAEWTLRKMVGLV